MSASPPEAGEEIPQSPEPDETTSHPEPETELKPYAGRWVARLGGRIVGQGGTPDQALRSAKASRFREQPDVAYVPIYPRVPFQDLLNEILEIVPADLPIYLVGGAVRDVLLGKDVHDLDFALPSASLETARRLANRLQAAYFPLDKERETGRVIRIDSYGKKMILDFALFRGQDLEADLRARDFTINAMALDLRHSLALLDPLGGAADLHAKLLKACSSTSLEDDPVRVLRAIRLAAAYNLHIQPETRKKMRQATDLLSGVTAERKRDEFFRILEGPQPATCLRALEMIGALPGITPEILNLRGLTQSPPHISDAWTHTLDVLAHLDSVLSILAEVYYPEAASNLYAGELSLRLGRYRQQITEYLAIELSEGRNLRGLLFLAALYHDAGKPATQQSEPSGRIRFFDHDQVGARIISQRGSELHLSNPEIDWLNQVVRNHMRPILLAKLEGGLSRKAIYRFFRTTGETGVGVCLLSLADTWATYGPGLPQEIWQKQVDSVRELLEAWWENPQESVHPPVLVNGHDLITLFGLEPGPRLGEILEKIREAQATGLVQSREQALDYARILSESQQPSGDDD
jgi:putative nucleotidyltransferase with HDIG domain